MNKLLNMSVSLSFGMIAASPSQRQWNQDAIPALSAQDPPVMPSQKLVPIELLWKIDSDLKDLKGWE